MATTTFVSRPPASSPLSAIQGTRAYGDGNPATVTTISYHFGNFPDTQTWTSEYKAEFRAALAAIESVANIRFVETLSFGSADLVEAIAPASFFDSPNVLGFHSTPSNGVSIGAFNTGFWKAGSNSNGDPGGFFFTTLLHELGHALGLGHPQDDGLGTTVMAGVTAPFGSFGVGGLNQGAYTVMSYNDGWTSNNGVLSANATYGGSTGLGALDIAALQAMYGANTSTNSGNDTYVIPAANVAGVGYQAIWDTGGYDSIWYQGSANARIDLRPATLDYTDTGGGVISFAEGVKGGFTIAQGVVIENAYGGAGDDLIFGNNAQNILRGNSGHDTFQSLSDGSNNSIFGGYGNDLIYVAVSTGADQVFGEQGNDVAVISSNAGSFSGGTGTDIARFVSALSGYLFISDGSTYQFLNVVTRITFSISSDVELIQFQNGLIQYDRSSIINATQLSDIDTTGLTLKHANQGVYVVDAGNSNVGVTLNGQAVGQNSIAGWQAVQTEVYLSGYKLLWKHESGAFSEWYINSAGQFVASAGIQNIVDFETYYNVDLNSDGRTGHFSTLIENTGGTSLFSSTHEVYLLNDNIGLTLNGGLIGANSIAGWQAIQAEAIEGGFKVLWKNGDGAYSEWTVNSAGQFQGSNGVGSVIDVEEFYNVDLNNDGRTGHFSTLIENDGDTSFYS
uniref:M10 family metallopeptidase C-terminal domain-containing protein n=1 Tax=Ruegeria atlantica TaxID=81569 RepID=UPI00147B31D8